MHNELKPVYWCGKITVCDICKEDFEGTMFDTPVNYLGRRAWGNVCDLCWHLYSSQKLGTGLGQKYVKQPDGRWLKVGG